MGTVHRDGWVGDICAVTCWVSPHTFIRFYNMDVTAPTMSHAVLKVGSLEKVKVIFHSCWVFSVASESMC